MIYMSYVAMLMYTTSMSSVRVCAQAAKQRARHHYNIVQSLVTSRLVASYTSTRYTRTLLTWFRNVAMLCVYYILYDYVCILYIMPLRILRVVYSYSWTTSMVHTVHIMRPVSYIYYV